MIDQIEPREFEGAETGANRRRKSRVSMMVLANVYFEGVAEPVTTRILDLSSGGIRIGAHCPVDRGHRVRIILKGVGEVGGRVAWSQRGEIGLQFDREIDTKLVGRALTGLPAATHIPFAKGFVPRPGFRIR